MAHNFLFQDSTTHPSALFSCFSELFSPTSYSCLTHQSPHPIIQICLTALCPRLTLHVIFFFLGGEAFPIPLLSMLSLPYFPPLHFPARIAGPLMAVRMWKSEPQAWIMNWERQTETSRNWARYFRNAAKWFSRRQYQLRQSPEAPDTLVIMQMQFWWSKNLQSSQGWWVLLMLFRVNLGGLESTGTRPQSHLTEGFGPSPARWPASSVREEHHHAAWGATGPGWLEGLLLKTPQGSKVRNKGESRACKGETGRRCGCQVE